MAPTVAATVPTTTSPSLTLIDRTQSSGRPERGSGHQPCLVGAGVPDAVHRPDDVGADLPANRTHVRVDGALAGAVAVTPDLGQHLLPRADHAGRLQQVGEQVELRSGQPTSWPSSLALRRGTSTSTSPARSIRSGLAADRSARRSSARTRAVSSRMLNGFAR